MNKVAIAITTFRNPEKLDRLLENMVWAGLPDVKIYVIQDPSPLSDHDSVFRAYINVYNCWKSVLTNEMEMWTPDKWGCMQGAIDAALGFSEEPWIIYVPDDVLFTPGALWNEYASVLAYGRDFVGGIQFPYQNSEEYAVQFPDGSARLSRRLMDQTYARETDFNWLNYVERSKHWDHGNIPRKYVNLNGAGFAINRVLYDKMGGWPKATWRLDEYAGFKAWDLGMPIITVPGPPRVHYFGGSTPQMPSDKPDFSSEAVWKEATGMSPYDAGMICRRKMAQIPETPGVPDGTWNDILNFFNAGGVLV